MNTQPQTAAELGAAVPRDRLGRLFDAVKFRLGGDGRPRFDVLGRFVNLRGGRKPKNKMSSNETMPAEPAPASPPSPAPAVTAPAPAVAQAPEPAPDFNDVRKALGAMPANDGPAAAPDSAADLAEAMSKLPENPTAESLIGIFQTALVLVGEEEGILTTLEKEMLRRPLVRVLDKYSIGANLMPAEIDLALVAIAIFVSRLQRPKTATWFMKVKAWFIGKFFAAKGDKLASRLRETVGPGVNPASEERRAA